MSDIERLASQHGARILLVDDTELNREIIGDILLSAGYEVDLASDGEEACNATWSRTYDLVLMDIEMPGMNGFEAAARIRAREGVMSGVKIAALTATQQSDAKQYSFWSGIDTFIAKPIEPRRLLRLVGGLVAEGGVIGNDWKPVWRLAVFAKFTGRLEEDEAADTLRDFSGLLDAAAAAIDSKGLASPEFAKTLRDVRETAAVLGFEEMAGLCKLVEAQRGETDARCRDPNLLGAIDRARYAIDVYRREHDPHPSLLERTRVNVSSLFRGLSVGPLRPRAH